MDYKQKIEEKRQKLVDTLIEFIENNPTEWEAGWYKVPSVPPFNGKTQKKYNGLNAFYLCVLGAMRGYKDPRWITFNQAKELGANVKSGAKSSEVFYWSKYDKKTKQPFDNKTCDGMTYEEAREYMDENVRPVIKFYQVFNAEQCDNMPEYEITTVTPEMQAEERRRQNAIIEQIISNSAAPVSYDGGNRAYYSPASDSIHLPEIKDFKTMQDYYATALHEIAHSTGHERRLNRNMSGLFGTPEYAKEELSAELASVFMQIEFGVSVEGKHFENHSAYLASWLKSVKDNKNEFFAAASAAEKITSYVADNYMQERKQQEQQESREHKENEQEAEPVFEANTSFAKQVDAVLSGADATSTHLKVMGTPLILRQLGAQNLPVLMTAKHLRNIIATHGDDTSVNYHGLDADLVKKLPELLADPVMVMDSLTRDDSVVILTSAVDKENRPIIGAIKFDGVGNLNDVEIDANILTSTYGRNNFNDFIKRNVEANSILYWDKEKSQELIKTPGLQLPDNLNSLTTNIIIRQAKAFVNSLDSENKKKSEDNEKTAKQDRDSHFDALNAVSPLYAAYMKTQGENPNATVLQRIGDFYEIMGANATVAAERLGLTLTGRDVGLSKRVPMCGFPFHVADEYISKLRESGDVVVTDENGEKILNKTAEQVEQVEQSYTGEQVGQAQQVAQFENTKEKYIIDLQLGYSNEMLLSNELKKLGYTKDQSVYETNEARDVAAFDTRTPFWLNEIRYNGQDGKTISGLYGRTSNGILIEATDISRFTLDGLSRAEAEQFVDVLREFGIEAALKQAEQDDTAKQAQQVGQAELLDDKVLDLMHNNPQMSLGDAIDTIASESKYSKPVKQTDKAEQAQQVGQAKWNKIPLDASLVGAERGKSTQLKMPDGEYSSFVFFAPTKFIRQDEKSGAVQLSVNDSFKYTLMKGNQRVELTGSELRQAMAGQVVGQRAQRSLSEANAQTLSDIYRNAPSEMRQYPNWCVYTTRWNDEKGKKDKQIFSPVLGLNKDGRMQWASIDKPETWATFDVAMKFAEENDCAGLVYALDGKGITCIDLDKSVVLNGKLNDAPTERAEGEMSALAARLSDELHDTYIETSASGNGIHIFVNDDLLAKGKIKNRAETPDGEIEVYDEHRFMSMTGKIRSATQRLGKSPVATTAWLQEKLGRKVALNQNAAQPRRAVQIDKSDSAVIERIRRSKKGTEFDALYRGENVTGDNSRNDFKLLNMLAFFTDCDASQMERIFRDSALYRPDKGEAYVQRSVSKACSTLQTKMSDRAFFGGGNNKGGGRGNAK